ncbi:hypothetical protein H2201_002557 [Coniosporium apollinis]|uniref:Late endosomal/lysosomal adaptor and MAPK and MTOR activator-domain-containing protein n=2 Tax=Coniosporium TaxID=2810619 RepID=A0ABQ9P214_9PEZI|nr:hypothetical protein H2199_005934 [Cladosporium sp. JES 115]KAJ9667356.1 hypothetical protein H2201_002557 [Coniosporium apollinis]
MGICASCLGLDRRPSQSDPSDTSQLLADQYEPQYGTINRGGASGRQEPDQEEIRRQRDALERICAQTSDKLIDVSQVSHTKATGPKLHSEYARLFSQRFPPSQLPAQRRGSRSPSSGSDVDEDEATWLSRGAGDDGEGEGPWDHVEPVDKGALTIQFDEALGVDRKGAQGR